MDTILKVRVATSAKARYERAAKSVGQSLSEWVREGLDASADCDLNEGGHAAPAPKVLPADPKEVLRQVGGLRPAKAGHTLTGRAHGSVPKGKK